MTAGKKVEHVPHRLYPKPGKLGGEVRAKSLYEDDGRIEGRFEVLLASLRGGFGFITEPLSRRRGSPSTSCGGLTRFIKLGNYRLYPLPATHPIERGISRLKQMKLMEKG
jgi:hypothetical protein